MVCLEKLLPGPLSLQSTGVLLQNDSNGGKSEPGEENPGVEHVSCTWNREEKVAR